MPGKTREEKALNRAFRPFRFFSTLLAVIALDRLFKSWVTRSFALEGDGFAVIHNVFHITRVNNTGAAFGLFKDHTPLLVGISSLGIVFFALFFLKRGLKSLSPLVWIGTALVIGGTIGNLIDRLRYGYVVDFLDFRVWPVFNIADAAITLGIAVLALYLIKEDRPHAPRPY